MQFKKIILFSLIIFQAPGAAEKIICSTCQPKNSHKQHKSYKKRHAGQCFFQPENYFLDRIDVRKIIDPCFDCSMLACETCICATIECYQFLQQQRSKKSEFSGDTKIDLLNTETLKNNAQPLPHMMK